MPVRTNNRPNKRAITSLLSAHITYPVRASWELSIFSFLAREEGKETPHACKLKCENERKERALVWLFESFGDLGRGHLSLESEAS